jgi:rare lipoprotein A
MLPHATHARAYRALPFFAKNYFQSPINTAFSDCFCLKTPADKGLLLFICCCFAVFVTGCGTTPKTEPPRGSPTSPTTAPSPTKPGGYYQDDGPGENLPANLDMIADAVPRDEPLHRGANRPYTVFGRSYVPNVSSDRVQQSGIASWYGRKFHGQKTSIGETYDMYAMTAAHPTLPLPSYVRVTNPANNRSVVVRLNDRGPFHQDRIIDLSYVAALKLDLIRRGSGLVNVERVFPGDVTLATATTSARPASPTSATTATTATAPMPTPTNIATSAVVSEAGDTYLQLAAFASADNAEIFRARMTRELTWNREPISVLQKDNLYRVRVGPYRTREAAESAAAQIRTAHDFSPIIAKP